MLFLKKKEINYEFYFNRTVIRLISNKQNISNKYIFSIKPKVQIYFWFKKIKEEELDFLKLFNHLILLWLITSQRASIKNLDSVLNKGIKYYRCVFFINIREIFRFINFINEILIPTSQKNSKKIHFKFKDKHLYSFSDLSVFTNLRLSSNLYLNSVHDKLFMSIKKKQKSKLNLNMYMNCLKI